MMSRMRTIVASVVAAWVSFVAPILSELQVTTAQPIAFEVASVKKESGGLSIVQLVSSLAQSTGRPVLDRTGLIGVFMLKLEFATEPGARTPFGPATAPANDAVAAAAPSLFSAIQDQLGLKLEARRAPTEVLVISGAERPTEN